jgi:hypothetical protein
MRQHTRTLAVTTHASPTMFVHGLFGELVVSSQIFTSVAKQSVA